MPKEEIVRADHIAKEFSLSNAVAREIVANQTQHALRKSKFAWAVLIIGLLVSGWLYFEPAANKPTALWILIFIITGWHSIGRYQAGPAIRAAAREKSERINRWNS